MRAELARLTRQDGHQVEPQLPRRLPGRALRQHLAEHVGLVGQAGSGVPVLLRVCLLGEGQVCGTLGRLARLGGAWWAWEDPRTAAVGRVRGRALASVYTRPLSGGATSSSPLTAGARHRWGERGAGGSAPGRASMRLCRGRVLPTRPPSALTASRGGDDDAAHACAGRRLQHRARALHRRVDQQRLRPAGGGSSGAWDARLAWTAALAAWLQAPGAPRWHPGHRSGAAQRGARLRVGAQLLGAAHDKGAGGVEDGVAARAGGVPGGGVRGQQVRLHQLQAACRRECGQGL